MFVSPFASSAWLDDVENRNYGHKETIPGNFALVSGEIVQIKFEI